MKPDSGGTPVTARATTRNRPPSSWPLRQAGPGDQTVVQRAARPAEYVRQQEQRCGREGGVRQVVQTGGDRRGATEPERGQQGAGGDHDQVGGLLRQASGWPARRACRRPR